MVAPTLRQCSPEEEQKLRLAIRIARAKLVQGVCGVTGLEQLQRSALAWLGGQRPLLVRCSECAGIPVVGFVPEQPPGEMTICRRLFTESPERIAAVFFHELIHVCGGGELDAEGLECHCFQAGGATLPGGSDYRLFRQLPARNGLYAGSYLVWHPGSGQVFIRGSNGEAGAPLNVRFVPSRNPQGGLSECGCEYPHP